MGKLLWTPSEQQVQDSNMYRFMTGVNRKYGTNLTSYPELWQWSVDHIPKFWAEMWDYAKVIASRSYDEVIDDVTRMPGARWFSGARLNFAENLLRYRDDRPAILFRGEDQVRRRLTYAELYREVAGTAASLRAMGLKPGDRVVGFMPNMPESIIAMLAATSLGATWSSCSPDFGIKGVLDRFGQIKPRVLFTADGYFFKGKRIDSLDRIHEILKQIGTVEKVVVIPYTVDAPDISALPNAVLFNDFRTDTANDIEFEQLPFDHPLYIMYSSGTTGLPKCMVQGAGGILLQQMKEHLLHTNLRREDRIFYFTTCGWMMWNWLTCALSVGATLLLYDGNPFHPGPEALWQMAEEEKMTVFGTSAGYIAALMNTGLIPREQFDLTALRALLSTGSPLSIEGFDFVYQAIKPDLQLASISGGTDINGCFALGNPMGPVYAGELQCRGLGMKVEAFDEKGQPVIGRQGELVCTAPAPSMPIYFWDDPDGKKYRDAYFDVYPNVWRHGDYIEINERGGVTIYGRSDATLNPGGVRIGTAEIYRQVEMLDEIEDSLVVGQEWKNDVRVILFVKMMPGYELTDDLKKKIRDTIRTNASPRHVPAKIVPVPDVPYTLNMKKVELAVKKTIQGQVVLNKDALKNPEILDFYADIKELRED
ncbi:MULTISPECIES: acetoacetate--CoA ligase [Desulfococcus]|jgi:acetoacetyl-CoA synthetase|uniref:Acetoacetyl-CoA synthase n=1 Tax=Desulfococcus multivorans DSM 2059 TaxID=1121405 RepID=S7UZN4_DESML|nr:acetoacetate--CoA ligase [Desulfococcus multivorans]AOY59614.1 AcsA6: acetyl-coenzyme A synthetase (acetate--CoA ligase) [Desulfococcus multivorans]AQV01803.1 acetoacetyl-CoA synthetase [Desulfococcus multivorans]EPR37898.1 acetoacetyl-CoA synthase [Desulfococcus multivorans DSM 2059]MDX9817387.1 acetoacetate--CoA ligase [Desulfococcus multivorans]SKA15972.1 acetoacetyl-CoA synthetase [Desulfococcus multivorans DSM 2059]